MDSAYIINRLKSTPYKYPTAALLHHRLNNLDASKRNEILSSLKKERHRHCNADIDEVLQELLYRMP